MFVCKINLNSFFSSRTISLVEKHCLVVFNVIFVSLSRCPMVDLFANVITVICLYAACSKHLVTNPVGRFLAVD